MLRLSEIEKILFLDCDGIITTPKTGWKPSCDKLILLWYILKATGCKIVISSSWRRNTLEETLETDFKDFPFKSEIIGITPHLYLPTEQGKWNFDTPVRGLEIDAYLNSLDKEVKYAILDDNVNFLYSQKDNLVYVDPYFGLSMDNVHKVIEILKGSFQKT